MSDRDQPSTASGRADGLLADLAMEVGERLQAGLPVDCEEYSRRFPQCAGSIHRLLPTICGLVAFGNEQQHSANPSTRACHADGERAPDPGHGQQS